MSNGRIDPISLEIYWSRLVGLMGEVDQVLLRTALSTIIAETRDFAFVLLDEQANAIAQSTPSLTVFTGILPYTTRALLERFPPETLADGDVLLTNDPWLGAGHLPDFCFVTPIFVGGRIVAYLSCLGHMQDVGGNLSYFGGRDVFEEGLAIPPTKLFRAGEINALMFEIIRANSRVPDLVAGDIFAIHSALLAGKALFGEFVADYGLADIAAISAAIRDRSRQAMEREIALIPDGTYRSSMVTDGPGEDSITIAARIDVAGSRMVVDFEGTSAETPKAAINCSLNYTRGSAFVALKSALIPQIPNNEGAFGPVTVLAPEGSLLNCSRNVAVKGRSVVAVHTHDVIFGALVDVIPGRVQAGSGSFWSVGFSGVRANGERFSASLMVNGGMGGKAGKPGLAATAYPWNSVATPTEILEHHAPIRLEQKQLRRGSGGAGAHDGGDGQVLVFRPSGPVPVTVSLRPVNIMHPPPGLQGGAPGARGHILLNGAPTAERLLVLRQGDTLEVALPGGGGFGAR